MFIGISLKWIITIYCNNVFAFERLRDLDAKEKKFRSQTSDCKLYLGIAVNQVKIAGQV